MRYLPINFHFVYIVTTMVISFFGPKIYLDYDKLPVSIFMFFYLAVVMVGFRMGYNKKKSTRNSNNKFNVFNLFRFCLIVSVLLMLTNAAYLSMSGRLNFQISSIGANYADFYEYYNEKTSEGNLFTFEIIFLVVGGIPKFVSLALGFHYYSSLSKFYKALFIALILLIVLTQTFSLGNQKSIGDIVIFAAIAIGVKAYSYSKKVQLKLARRVVVVLIAFFSLLSFTQYSRLDSREIGAAELNEHMAAYSYFDLEHPLFRLFGLKFGLGIAAFTTGYLSNGYYGLSKTLELPFEWTYGVGCSVALSNIVEKVADEDIYKKTYLARMDKKYGIPGKTHWHTIFPWLASDFSFVGTLLLFYFTSFYYGIAWKEVLLYKNEVSLLLFALLSMMFIFVPANNQILHGFDYITITFFVSIYWRMNHAKRNYTA